MSTFTGVGSPGTVSAASGGYFLAYNAISTTPAQVIAADPQRQSITFHNPGANDIMIAPAFIQNTGSDVALVPSPSALGGCFRVYGNGASLTLTGGQVQKPFQAFSLTGSTNPLTVVASNVA